MPSEPAVVLIAIGIAWWRRRRLFAVLRWLWRWPGRLAWRLLWALVRMLARPAWPQAVLLGGVAGTVAVVLWSSDATWLAGAAMIAAAWTGLWVAEACWILSPQRRVVRQAIAAQQPAAASTPAAIQCRRCKALNTRIVSGEERRKDGVAIGSADYYICDECFDIRRVS